MSNGKSVVLRGPALSVSGYGTHCRQIAKWLLREAADRYGLDVTVQPLPWGTTHFLLDPDLEDGLIGQILQASGNQKPFYDVSVQVQLPNEWDAFLAGFNIGVTAGVETETCNPAWITAINNMDLVVVPSEFTKQTFINTGNVKTPIVVIPESFPEAYETATPDALEGLDRVETAFNFLIVGQLTGNGVENDRKNIPYTMKWLAETFAGNKDVGVIIKTNSGADTELDKQHVRSVFAKLVSEVQGLNTDRPGPTFYLLHGHMNDAEMFGLYKHPKVKALVALTHGEGYGLPILEASACGLPVIATNWSGHLDFLRHGKFLSVDKTIGEVHPSRVDGQIFMQGAKWAYPLEQDAKKRLKKFYEAPVMPTTWASDLAKVVRQKYSFATICDIYNDKLGVHLTSSAPT